MLIYLHGPDSYRRQQKLIEVSQNYRQKHSVFSEDIFDLEYADDFYRLLDFAGQTSLFASKKLAIIKNPEELNAKDLKKFKELLTAHLKNDDLILIVSSAENLPKNFAFLLEKPTVSQEFSHLPEGKMEFFINKEAQKRGIKLSQKAVEFLAKVFRNNTWAVISELDRLQFLKTNFDDKELIQLIDYFKEPNIFGFTDSISRNKPLAQKLQLLEILFLNNEEPAKIFNILAKNPYLFPDLVEGLANYDVQIKSGKLDYDTALFDLCL